MAREVICRLVNDRIMATITRITVLLTETPPGFFTACAIDLFDVAACVGASAKEALGAMEERLEKLFLDAPWTEREESEGFEVAELKVTARPEYTEGKRVFPCAETLVLRLPAVLARDRGGLGICTLPALGLRFEYTIASGWKSLAQHFATQQLRGLTPAALIRFAAPGKATLHTLPIRSATGSRRRDASAAPVPAALSAVAEPLPGVGPAARRQATAWERGDLVEDLMARLTQEKSSVLLVGEPGVGKTTILADAARRLARSADEEEIRLPRFWRSSAARLIAGMQYLGQWEARCEAVVAALGEIPGVLCVENLLDLVRIGGTGARDSVGAFLVPYLQRGELRLVAEASPAELDACRRLLPELAEACEVLRVPAFEATAAQRLLERFCDHATRDLKLEIAPDVAAMVRRLFRRFQPYESFPGRATRFLRELLARRARAAEKRVSVSDVMAEFSAQTGLPEWLLRDDCVVSENEVVAHLESCVLGQPAACRAAAQIVTRFKSGLNDPTRPLAVQLFCGPTGVGKTALARALAGYLFGADPKGAEDRLVRLDLSEFALPGSARRLISADDGGPSELVRWVRAQPLCIVLFDEVEKADPEVFDVLLGLFDEGRLTDPFGRVTDFRQAVVLLTSNLGADRSAPIGFTETGSAGFAEAVAKFFRPEFFNRLDGVVEFQSLSPERVKAIAMKALAELSDREGLRAARLRFVPTPALTAAVAAAGFDHRYGARPLQRAVEELVVTPLAAWLLEHLGVCDATIRGDARVDGVFFSVSGDR